MRIDLLFPAYPPALDGIGDYTAHLANTLSGRHDVRVWTGQTPPPGASEVTVHTISGLPAAAALTAWADQICADPPDWLVVQYNPFAYGTRGYAPALVSTLSDVRSRCPQLRIAVTVHEPFMPPDSIRLFVMSLWQRRQFKKLGRLADHLIFAIELWVERFDSWFPDTPCTHIPVGSNMPHIALTKADARARTGLPSDACVLGLFGRGHPSRLFDHIRHGMQQLEADGHRPLLLYIGPGVDRIRTAFPDVRLHCTGALPAAGVSHHLSAMDVYLAPYHKGVSTRRGAFLAGLQHALPVLTTSGPQTDMLLHDAAGSAFTMTPRDNPDAFGQALTEIVSTPALQHQLGRGAQSFYLDHFQWPVIASQYERALAVAPMVPPPHRYTAPFTRTRSFT
ncbi:MAG: glycosyltransferase family 4 protein [Bacteroidota bacterium]